MENLGQYLLWQSFPWSPGTTVNWIAAVVVAVALVYSVAVRREIGMVFLSLGAFVTVLPVIPFPFAIERYLYLPAVFSAVFLALAFEFVRTRLMVSFWRGVIVPGMMVGFFLWNSAAVSETAFNYTGFARATRLQFRPIFQKHPSFGPDTVLYFIEPPFPTPTISGMMFLKYGANVSVYGTDRDRIPNLREHAAAFVYYRGSQGDWQEQSLDKSAIARASPPLPSQFQEAIQLAGMEIVNPKVNRGESIVLVLFWQSGAKVERDYTVFVHLINAQGQTVAGFDSSPRQGDAPTSSWRPNALISDGRIIPIDKSIPPGEYQLTVGLYDPKTMRRLSVLDANGNPMTDQVVIAPITVEDQDAR